MSKRIYLKNPIRLLLTFVVIVSMTIAIMLIFQVSASGDSVPQYRTIVVAKGDTLWNIAKNNRNEELDIQAQISEIKELNKINSNVKVGQELVIRMK